MSTFQQWHDDSERAFGNAMGRAVVAQFSDAPIPRIGEHVYTNSPSHEWIVTMVRYNMETRSDGAMLVSVQLEKLW